MSNYHPDRWVVIKLTDKRLDTSVYKVLASWYGGYTGSDSWKLNSGITAVIFDGTAYQFEGATGSTYYCHKDSFGMSNHTLGIYSSWEDEADKSDEFTVEIVTIEELHAVYRLLRIS